MFGVEPAILDSNGAEIEGPGEGILVVKRPWPGQVCSFGWGVFCFVRTTGRRIETKNVCRCVLFMATTIASR
jgi:hypothetical protein